jgi:hypothetical protein
MWIVATVLLLSLAGATQEEELKSTISTDALTPEQVAIYRVVLKEYIKGSDGVLNLADKTDPFDESNLPNDESCFQEFKIPVAKGSDHLVHRISPAVVSGTRIVLVDPDQQSETVAENDPQHVVKRAIDDHEEVSDKQLEQSVKRAFETGLFTLSEIAFDKEHRYAIVAYGFNCGMLCGNGNTLVLKKVKTRWKIAKRCGGWVS